MVALNKVMAMDERSGWINGISRKSKSEDMMGCYGGRGRNQGDLWDSSWSH